MSFIPPTLPAEPPFEILEGALFMGAHQLPGALLDFDVVFGVAKERPVRAEDHPNAIVEHVLLVDDGPPSPEDWDLACATADRIHAYLEAGKRIYVGCSMGINRSALVTALALKRTGLSGHAAVNLIRRKRGSVALSNAFFEALIKR